MKDYRIRTIVSKIRTALDKIDAEKENNEFQQLTTEEEILKSDLLSALDILEKYEFM